jgi:3-oxoacyl-[acyl-carrier-protein] synthase III
MPAFVNAITYKLGEHEHDLDELTDVLPGTRKQLREAGLETYYVTEESPTELAREPMERTLDALGNGHRDSIRRVIFASNSVGHEALATPHAISRLLADVGLTDAFPMGVFLAWCANFQVALELARSLIDTGQEETVLVVCSDVHWKPDRLVSPRISVHSDAAVAFTVSKEDGPFELVSTRVKVDPKLGDINRETQFVQYMDGVARGVAGVSQGAMEDAKISIEDIGRLIPNNYNKWVCRSMAKIAGFTEDRVYLDNVPRFAHALAADNPINLDHYHRECKPPSGEWVALLGSGAFQWGFSLMRVT